MTHPSFFPTLRDLISREELPSALKLLRELLDYSPMLDEAGGDVHVKGKTTVTESQTSRRQQFFLWLFVPLPTRLINLTQHL